MIRIIGPLFWRFAKLAMPWARPWLGYGVAAIAAVGIIWLHGYMIGNRGKEKAIAVRDSHWAAKINETNNEINDARRRARNAANRVTDTPIDRAKRLQLCRQSPTCREHNQ